VVLSDAPGSLKDEQPENSAMAARRKKVALGQTTYDCKCSDLRPSQVEARSNTALYLALAYVWLSEGNWHDERDTAGTAGFEGFRDYVVGYSDGVPKRPQWAAPISGVPSYTIKALARHWDGAFDFGDEEQLAGLVAKAELLRPELAARPRGQYTGLPDTLIGGTVYDYEADEVIEEETELTIATDELGNFLVDGPEQGTYLVLIEKEGYVPKVLGPIKVEDDLNLRDFAMLSDSRGLIW
jgi:hypothetical protein